VAIGRGNFVVVGIIEKGYGVVRVTNPADEYTEASLGFARKDRRPVTRKDVEQVVKLIEQNGNELTDPKNFYPRLDQKQSKESPKKKFCKSGSWLDSKSRKPAYS